MMICIITREIVPVINAVILKASMKNTISFLIKVGMIITLHIITDPKPVPYVLTEMRTIIPTNIRKKNLFIIR